jgi:hypothetical protein
MKLAPPEKNRCSSITLKGEQCKRLCSGTFCEVHKKTDLNRCFHMTDGVRCHNNITCYLFCDSHFDSEFKAENNLIKYYLDKSEVDFKDGCNYPVDGRLCKNKTHKHYCTHHAREIFKNADISEDEKINFALSLQKK